jgi:hypothetical protein
VRALHRLLTIDTLRKQTGNNINLHTSIYRLDRCLDTLLFQDFALFIIVEVRDQQLGPHQSGQD